MLYKKVDRPNLLVKIPGTSEGLPAITATIADGISVNVTLIFGLDRYGEVMNAYLEGLEKAKENGEDLSKIHSVASFFVSRVDSEIDKQLEKIGTEKALSLRGKAGIANARLAFERYEDVFCDRERWNALKAAGANPQRPLWASTGVKNPEYSDTMYVTELVARGIVNTMPEKTLDAVADHGDVHGDSIHEHYHGARHVMSDLEMLGIDYDAVIATLEKEGVEKFVASWKELVETVDGQMSATADGKKG
jgi:transaldolase